MEDIGSRLAAARLEELDGDGWQAYDPNQWDSAETSEQPRKGTDPQWINVEDIRQWIYACEYGHGPSCCPAATSTTAGRSLWLVDVVSQCIVPAEDVRYIALSYVWGNAVGIEATQEKVDKLLQPGSLDEDNDEVIIPKTVRHAMKLVNLFGERYLWVDRLCIVQDDSESKHSQLALMGDIFQGAYFTIVAANGWDANHGLRGIKGYEVEYMRHIQREETIWYSRGWTFQEMFFSTRTLSFLYQYAVWECSTEVWHETTGITGALPALTDGTVSGNRVALKQKFLSQSNQPLRQASHGQSKRFKPLEVAVSDGLNAFLGITSRMAEFFPSGFLYGLPIDVFDVALLWQPFEVMARREPRHKDAPQLPSWSWVGWQGRLLLHGWKEQYQNMASVAERISLFGAAGDEHTTLITPVAEFFYVRDGDIQAIKMASDTPRNDAVTPLSRQPSPVLRVQSSVAKVKLWRHGPVLGAGFYLRDDAGYYHWITPPEATEPSPQCGVLFMQSDLHAEIPDVSECELMALSRGTSPLEGDYTWPFVLKHYPLPERLRERGRFEYYDVMWITRKNGVAFRKAIGKISTTAWDSLSPQQQFFELG
ncbi:HET-domain-containing protein [Xylariaceae sp. FL0594]|nr:HET-domain-containing protein [Xylariaceae sp. FL0594]